MRKFCLQRKGVQKNGTGTISTNENKTVHFEQNLAVSASPKERKWS